MTIAQEKPVHHPRTASRAFGGEVVIVDPIKNMVRMLNPVASRMWELADGTRTTEQIGAELAEEFDVDPVHAQRSAAAFIEELLRKELLTLA